MFILPAELTIAHIELCKSQLLEVIDADDEISFDDSEVVRVDTLGMQLLLACVIYISSKNKVLHWQSSSKVIRIGVNQLGLNEPILQQYLLK